MDNLLRLMLTAVLVAIAAIVAMFPAPATAHEDPDVPPPGTSVAVPSTVPSYSQARQWVGAGSMPAPPSGGDQSEGNWAHLWFLIAGGGAIALGAGMVRVAVARRRMVVPDLGRHHESIDVMDAEVHGIVTEQQLDAHVGAGR